MTAINAVTAATARAQAGMNQEQLGPAERILQSVLTYTDHMVHNRPGILVPDGRTIVGVRWDYASWRIEDGHKIAYRLAQVKQGKKGVKTIRTRAGVLGDDGRVVENGREVGQWRPAGIFPEVATWMYLQVAEVWKIDNEFAARWASYQFAQEHRDLKVILAAFMLVQSRKGEPVLDNGKLVFHDDDYRDVGEAMMLIYQKADKADKNRKADKANKKDKALGLDPKLLLRIHDVLRLPGIVAINRELGFGQGARGPVLGRWNKVTHKWLRYREENPNLLAGLIKAGFRTTLIALACASRYEPESDRFFEALRWKQAQAADGRRQMGIGKVVQAAESWVGLTEAQICEKVVKEKVGWKRIVSLLPRETGLTRAIMAAAIEGGSLSDKDLIIATPTIEELGLMDVQEVKDRWQSALHAAEDMRAANIAQRVHGQEAKEKLAEAADTALKKAAEEVMRAMRVYVFVDRSGSMEVSIEAAIRLLTRMLPAFPRDRVHVAHFNTIGKEVAFKAISAAGVAQAFKGIAGTGGTDYGAGVQSLQHYRPKDDEDVLFIFVGDQEARPFVDAVNASGLRPMAFGLVHVKSNQAIGGYNRAVEDTAIALGLPCFRLDEKLFEDTYAVPRTLRALIAATPVTRPTAARPVTAPRVTLVKQILATELLQKPAWAA